MEAMHTECRSSGWTKPGRAGQPLLMPPTGMPIKETQFNTYNISSWFLRNDYMYMVSVSMYEHYIMGGRTSGHYDTHTRWKNIESRLTLDGRGHLYQELVCVESCDRKVLKLWAEHAKKALSRCIHPNTRRCCNTQKLWFKIGIQ